MIPNTSSSGTSFPACMNPWACLPSSVPWLMACRSKSPVDTCGILEQFDQALSLSPFSGTRADQ